MLPKNLPLAAQSIIFAAIDIGFNQREPKRTEPYVVLEKGEGLGRLVILVGGRKCFFVIQTGEASFDTKETARFLNNGQNSEALEYLRTKFINL